MNDEFCDYDLRKLKENNVDEKLKKILLGELVDSVNKYIGNDLEIGRVYKLNGRDNIIDTINRNIRKGLEELFEKYDVDIKVMENYLKIGTYCVHLTVSYNEVSVWTTLLSYDFGKKFRENASLSNSNVTLVELPKIVVNNSIKADMVDIIHDYNNMNLEGMNLYEVMVYLLEGQRQKSIGRLQSSIIAHKRVISEDKKNIEKLEEYIIE